MKFTCPRCLEESVGREYHKECFDAIYEEHKILQIAIAERRAKAEARSAVVVDEEDSKPDIFVDRFLELLRASGVAFEDAIVPREKMWRHTM